MPASHPIYKHIDDVERLALYQPGGYHPVPIADRLNKRYRVVHKLGYGTYSTTWLARDEQSSKLVAVKVGTADSNAHESEILNRLAKPAHTSQGQTEVSIPPVLDHFSIQGPNGTHPCLVTIPARCSISDTKEASNSGLFQLTVARYLIAQLVLAVAQIHERGYVHGDLHLGNILLQLPSGLTRLSDKHIYDQFDPPDPEPVVRADGQPLSTGVPNHAYTPIWLGRPSEQIPLSEARLLLVDFGTAFDPTRDVRVESYTPLEIRPPEVRFEPEKKLSFASDIWSLGFTIWSIIAQRPLLDSFLMSPDDVTADQVDTIGPLPTAWWDAWEGGSKRFAQNGQAIEGRSVWSWDQRFEDSIQEPRRKWGMETLDDAERDAFVEMLRRMLVFLPSDRASAQDILRCSWMRNWVLPRA